METVTNTTMELIGSLDRLDREYIEGWLTAQNAPTLKILLEILLDGQVIGHCIADRFRQDLSDAGIGGGACAFSFAMPALPPAASLRQIEIAVAGSPLRLNIPAKLIPKGS